MIFWNDSIIDFFSNYFFCFSGVSLASGVIAGSKNCFQNLKLFFTLYLNKQIFEPIFKGPYPLKMKSLILENSAALSPIKTLLKRSIVTLVMKTVDIEWIEFAKQSKLVVIFL